jgi:hypothetical protein
MVVANFVAGVLVGTLLGLALAPLVRSWLAWKTVEESRRAAEPLPGRSSTRGMERSDSLRRDT